MEPLHSSTSSIPLNTSFSEPGSSGGAAPPVTHGFGVGTVNGVLKRTGDVGHANWGVTFGRHLVSFTTESMARFRQLEISSEDVRNLNGKEVQLTFVQNFGDDPAISEPKLHMDNTFFTLDTMRFIRQTNMAEYGNSFRTFIMQFVPQGQFPMQKIKGGRIPLRQLVGMCGRKSPTMPGTKSRLSCRRPTRRRSGSPIPFSPTWSTQH